MSADLLRLLELAHPGRPQADLLAMIEATPDALTKGAGKPIQRRIGSRPRSTASMERRRSWAASGRMPPKIAARFTLAEQAVLAVVAAEVAKHGTCTLAIGQIAALAGVCNQTVRNAFREAVRLEFTRVEERRLSAWRNDTNRVTITSPEWLSWLRLRPKGGGSKSVEPTNTKIQNREVLRTSPAQKGLPTSGGRIDRARITRLEPAGPPAPGPLEAALARFGAGLKE